MTEMSRRGVQDWPPRMCMQAPPHQQNAGTTRRAPRASRQPCEASSPTATACLQFLWLHHKPPPPPPPPPPFSPSLPNHHHWRDSLRAALSSGQGLLGPHATCQKISAWHIEAHLPGR